MKLLYSFFLTGILAGLTSVSTLFLLSLLHIDDPRLYDSWYILVGVLFTALLIPVMFFLVYLPIYLFNKKDFIEKDTVAVYERYLFMPLIPIFIAGIFCQESIIKEADKRIVFISLLFSILSGFYVFTKTIKKW
jgi:tellurite resistance protein TehA-like permease